MIHVAFPPMAWTTRPTMRTGTAVGNKSISLHISPKQLWLLGRQKSHIREVATAQSTVPNNSAPSTISSGALRDEILSDICPVNGEVIAHTKACTKSTVVVVDWALESSMCRRSRSITCKIGTMKLYRNVSSCPISSWINQRERTDFDTYL